MARIFGSSEVCPPEESPWRIDIDGRPVESVPGDAWGGPHVGTGPRSLRVACLSDTHGAYAGLERQLHGADLVLLAGDLLDYRQRDRAALAALDAWLEALPQRRDQIVVVAGNHALALCGAARTPAARAAALPHATYLEGGVAAVAGGAATVAGGPWILARPFWNISQSFALSGTALVDKWAELTRLVLAARTTTTTRGDPITTTTGAGTTGAGKGEGKKVEDPSYVDILLTHGPPEGVLDLDYKQRRTGTVALRDAAVVPLRPRVHVFGHNHDKGRTVWGTVRRRGRDAGDYPPHRMLFVCAAATFSRHSEHFALHLDGDGESNGGSENHA